MEPFSIGARVRYKGIDPLHPSYRPLINIGMTGGIKGVYASQDIRIIHYSVKWDDGEITQVWHSQLELEAILENEL